MGHAIETLTGYAIAHGEAVALGLLFAAHLGRELGRIDDARVDEHYRVVHGVYGLTMPVPGGLGIDALIDEMGRDKKALSSLTFVLDSADGLQVVPGVPRAAVERAYAAFAARNP